MKKINNMFQFFLDIQIEDFRSYIYFMEGNIDSHKKRLEEDFNNRSEELQELEKEVLLESIFHDPYTKIDTTYTLLLRKSLFLTLYAFIETELRSIALKLEKSGQKNIKISDIRHRGLYQYLFYIENVHNIPLNISSQVRKNFKNYNTLRNYFVHSDRTAVNRKQYKELTNITGVNWEVLSINDDFYYVESLDKEFNSTYLNSISDFFDSLFEGLDKTELI